MEVSIAELTLLQRLSVIVVSDKWYG